MKDNPCNMATECSARTGICEADEMLFDWHRYHAKFGYGRKERTLSLLMKALNMQVELCNDLSEIVHGCRPR